MRVQHWLKVILGSSLLAVSSLSAQAQPPGMPVQMAPPGYMPTMPADGYGSTPLPDYGQVPPSMYSPWPQVSPYENSYSQHSLESGLWNSDSNNSTRRYKFSVDYLSGRGRVPTTVIGNTSAQSYINMLRTVLDNQQGGGGGGGGQNQQGTSPLALFGGDPNIRPPQPSFQLYGAANFGAVDRDFRLQGTRTTVGFDNPDDSGLRFSFLYLADNNFQYNAMDYQAPGRGTEPAAFQHLLQIPEDPANPLTVLPRDLSLLSDFITPVDVNRILQNNVFNLNGLPLDDGTLRVLADGTTFGGVTAPYDLDFKINLYSELYGGNVDWIMNPVINGKFFRVRPIVSPRYFCLREGLHFFGRDSGLVYGDPSGGGGGGGGGGGNQTLSPDLKLHSTPNGLDDNGDFIIDNAGLFEDGQQQGGGGGGGGGGQQNQDQVPFLQFQDQFRYPISSYLNNDVQSQLGGADVGLTYDFGGHSLLVTGTTRFGLLANYEQIKISGDNIAMHTRASNLLDPSPANATPNAFTAEQSHMHVSPMFEQSFNAEAPLFRYVPVIRRIGFVEKAQFRFGYSFMYIGHVVDPTSSILWQGNPAAGLFPLIKVNRDSYTAHSYNFGISWQF